MDQSEATVLLVDDDANVREAVSRLLRSAGWKTELFASAQEFLAAQPRFTAGCVLLDVCMPGMTGPELHAWLRDNQVALPVIFLSGNADVSTTVKAMKGGAYDFLEKPADADVLLQTIASAIDRDRLARARRDADNEIAGRVATLSSREREVMDHVLVGRLNKQIAADLEISEKTVKVHRGRVMAKMKVRSVAQLVHLCDQLGLSGPA